ncbi:tyrosine-type recombinase/integrase [Heyndrickxia sp. FSL W8-0496]|uniref:tyrosine-type recombinase/integrase n=1 Tax=Heyndrickxia sp. FSL W8-0496 TaxID=2954702 RepID=UPI0030F8C40A
MINLFEIYITEEGKSENTIKGYIQSIQGFLKWFEESKGIPFTKLHRENVREYISFLKTIKGCKPKTINTKLNALVKFNEFLVVSKVQTEMIITKKDYIKVQQQFASLAKVEFKDVEKFRQLILDSGNKRNYAIITLLSYAGLRITEALNLKMSDFNTVSREIIVNGKGDKTRTVFMSDKVKNAIQSWLRERNDKGIDNEFIFVSNRNKRLNRTTVNKLFNDYSQKIGKNITPHDLRHFFCSHALESGMSVHEVANQAGHSNIHTTLLYTNPSKDELIQKMNQL